MSLENVKIGDKLVVNNYYGEKIEIVERITKTLVITKFNRFNKSSGRSQGSSSWHYVYAKLANEDDIKRILQEERRRELICQCNKIKFNGLSIGVLEQILEIAKGGQ